MTFHRIETSRLFLAPLQMKDALSMLEYHSNPEVVKYIPWPVRDLKMVEETLAEYLTLTDLKSEGDYLMLGLYRKSDKQLIGQMNVMYRSEQNRLAEFGYVLNPRFSKNGFATEASKALVTELFNTGKFRRVIAKMDARNIPSAELCKRLGFRLEAHHLQDDFFKEEWTDTLIYATLQEDWFKARANQ